MQKESDKSTFLQPGEQVIEQVSQSIGLVQTQYVRFFDGPDQLKLECGQTLGPIDVAYETYGQLNERRDNAILIVHALSGDAHVAGRHKIDDHKPGWWDIMVGPGKPFDTDRYFVVCSNCLGGCMGSTGPSSIDPRTNKPYGMTFPIITISDMVEVQRHLIDYLGIDRLLAVVGGSMGGMQVLDWAIRYPNRVAAAFPIATTARLSAQGIAFDAVARNAILSDKNFQGGTYYNTDSYPSAGLAVARMIGHITYLSEEAMHKKFGRHLQNTQDYQYILEKEFRVESYLDYQGSIFVDRFDANTYLYFSKAMDYFDLMKQYGCLEEAFRPAQCRFLVISFDSDWLFPSRQSREIVDALIIDNKDVTYLEVSCPYGHDSFLLDWQVQGRLVSGFLRQTHQKLQRAADSAKSAQPVSKKAHRESPAVGRISRKSGSIFEGQRVDHREIVHLIEPNSTVLDLGCGDGRLLALLQEEKNIHGMGLTLGAEDIIACAEHGVSVAQYDIGKYLGVFAEKSYDYVVLSKTLQVIRRPTVILRELLRIGRKIIVSLPNFAYWQGRLQLMLGGKAPVWKTLPYTWFNKPEESVNYMSISDFEDFVHKHLNARLIKKLSFHSQSGREIRLWSNLLADEAIFVIADKEYEKPPNR